MIKSNVLAIQWQSCVRIDDVGHVGHRVCRNVFSTFVTGCKLHTPTSDQSGQTSLRLQQGKRCKHFACGDAIVPLGRVKDDDIPHYNGSSLSAGNAPHTTGGCPSKHALTGPIQDLNGQVRAIRANLSLINPVWDLYGLPVLNPQYHALINPVWDLYVFARMISATTGPYRSCTGSVWVCLNLQQGGSPKRRETHWRRRLAPTLNNNWHGLCFYSLIPR